MGMYARWWAIFHIHHIHITNKTLLDNIIHVDNNMKEISSVLLNTGFTEIWPTPLTFPWEMASTSESSFTLSFYLIPFSDFVHNLSLFHSSIVSTSKSSLAWKWSSVQGHHSHLRMPSFQGYSYYYNKLCRQLHGTIYNGINFGWLGTVIQWKSPPRRSFFTPSNPLNQSYSSKNS